MKELETGLKTGLNTGRYRARACTTPDDFDAVLRLRARCFGPAGGQADKIDPKAKHILIETGAERALVGCFRLLTLPQGAFAQSYSAQFYDLSALRDFPGNHLELGRFCIDPTYTDPEILRLAWAMITQHVDGENITLLFGCASFKGTDATPYLPGFAALKQKFLAPSKWAPKVKAADVIHFAHMDALQSVPASLNVLPALLRSYLTLGGWVSDHAVIDREMDTLHVFTGVEVASIPPKRQKALRALAQL